MGMTWGQWSAENNIDFTIDHKADSLMFVFNAPSKWKHYALYGKNSRIRKKYVDRIFALG